MRRPCCFRVQRAWSQRPPVSSASSCGRTGQEPRGSPGPLEFTTLCSKHLLYHTGLCLGACPPRARTRLACPCPVPKTGRGWAQSGTPTSGAGLCWGLRVGSRGHSLLASRAAKVASGAKPDAGIRPWVLVLEQGAAMSPYLLQKTLSITWPSAQVCSSKQTISLSETTHHNSCDGRSGRPASIWPRLCDKLHVLTGRPGHGSRDGAYGPLTQGPLRSSMAAGDRKPRGSASRTGPRGASAI